VIDNITVTTLSGFHCNCFVFFATENSAQMQQDSTGSASMIAELKTLINEKDFQLEKQDSLLRDQSDRIDALEQSLFRTKQDLEAAKNEAIRSCECKIKVFSNF
jgi:septal ring factor EnvC (AmiA/AmiB activator)